MRIIITTEGVPSERYPMLGIFAFDQAVALQKKGHEVIVLAVDVRSFRRKRKWGMSVFRKEGVIVYNYNFPLGAFPVKIIDFFKNRFFDYLLSKVLDDYGKIDIVHAHFGLTSGYSTAKACVKRNMKYWVTEHGSNVHVGNLSRYTVKKMIFTYKNAVNVFSVSNSLSNRIYQITGIDSFLIPNMLNEVFVNNFNPIEHGTYNFICVAGLNPAKRVAYLVKIFIESFKNVQGVDLYICGEGRERALIEKLVKDANMNNRIHLLGCVSRTHIANLLNKMDCFVLPSVSETFGVAYLEALSMGVPVITTKCGGPEDFVNENNGCLIPIDDADSLGQALLKIKNRTCEFDKERIRETILEHYSQEKIVEKLLIFYKGNYSNNESV